MRGSAITQWSELISANSGIVPCPTEQRTHRALHATVLPGWCSWCSWTIITKSSAWSSSATPMQGLVLRCVVQKRTHRSRSAHDHHKLEGMIGKV
eukprot:583256-Amphidinium_carterae.1